MNVIIGSIPILLKEISNMKNGEPIPVHQFSDLPAGINIIVVDNQHCKFLKK